MVETERLGNENEGILTKAPLVYLFVYVNDLPASRDFYERQLGLRVIEQDSASVKYDTGEIILCLNRGHDYGITVAPGRHETTDIVFLVDDIDCIRSSLEDRGVEFTATLRYEPGAICDFYDPDGHWFSLYEPNEDAMEWPSADKIRAVWRACGRGESKVIGPAAVPEKVSSELRLDGKPLVYLFLFVRDPQEAQKFYYDGLGLADLEGGPCSNLSGGDEDGVIKYDAGGLVLTTHGVEETRTVDDVEQHPCPPRLYDAEHMNALAFAFHVTDIDKVVEELSGHGIPFNSGVIRSDIGAVAKFNDPSGHVFYLYEASDEALRGPSGPKVTEILSAPV